MKRLFLHFNARKTATRLFIHFGAHKTATTSLQLYFQEKVRWLRRHGIAYISPDTVNNQQLHLFLHGHRSQPSETAGRHRSFLKKLIRTSGTSGFLISHESLFSFAGDPRKERIYPSLQTALKRFREINVFDAVSVKFALREPAAFLQSIYLQNLGAKFTGPFERYSNSINIQNVSWSPIVEQVENAGFDEVGWELYEDLGHLGSKQYLKLFTDWLRLPHNPSHELPRSNPSLSLVAARMLQASGLTCKNVDAKKRYRLRNFLKKHFPVKQYGKANFLTDDLKKRVRDELMEDHASLFEHLRRQDDFGLWGC